VDRLTFILDVVEQKKHSVRYRTSVKNPPVESIYIARTHLGNPAPKAVVVTIEDADSVGKLEGNE